MSESGTTISPRGRRASALLLPLLLVLALLALPAGAEAWTALAAREDPPAIDAMLDKRRKMGLDLPYGRAAAISGVIVGPGANGPPSGHPRCVEFTIRAEFLELKREQGE